MNYRTALLISLISPLPVLAEQAPALKLSDDRHMSKLIQLTFEGDNGETYFSFDGKRIVFSSNMDGWRETYKTYGHNFELYLINSDGSGLERVTYNQVFDSFPMFSPDGRKIVFGSNRNPQKPHATDIFIADWTE
jgi:Tol biopolymer transport system component